MRRVHAFALCAALTAAISAGGATTARADGPSDGGTTHAIAVAANASIHVRSIGRPVHVVGWSRPEVKVTGGGGLMVQVSEDHARVTVVAGPDAGRAGGGGEPIELSVPTASSVDARSVSGEVTVADVTGEVRAGSVQAGVRVKGSPKEVEADTVSGAIELDLAVCDVRAASMSGAVRVQCRGKTARVRGKTVSARLDVKATGTFERLELRSVSGTVDADGKLTGDGPFELRSHSGDVTLAVPKGTALVVDARSRGRIEVKPSAPDAAASAPTVTLRTFSGDIRVTER
jgi:Putative adhesin